MQICYLRYTEERAQNAESQVANLELSLKAALEKIRKLENAKQIDFEKLDTKAPEKSKLQLKNQQMTNKIFEPYFKMMM